MSDDNLIVIGMFLLRVAVPVILTVAVGYWLEKRLGLERPEFIVPEARQARPVRLADAAVQTGTGVLCWQVENCGLLDPGECAAYARPAIPFWLAREVAYEQQQTECPGRELHKLQAIPRAAG